MRDDRVFSVGNLKFEAGRGDQKTDVKTRFGLQADVPLILAASTHAPEEKIVIESFKKLRESQPPPLTLKVRLMIAPRKPERFNEVAELIQGSVLSWTRRTNEPAPEDANAAVILLDTIGELTSVYSHASVVFVGGSIVDRGGHNVLEPAAHGVAVVTGAHTHNFHAIVDLLNEAKAIVQLPPVEGEEAVAALAEALRGLLVDAEWRNELGSRAKQIVAANQGATEKTMKLIAPLFVAPAAKSSSSSDSLQPANAT
jgi:3-deoxy-D-manno-octulosonic-acid transferase